MATNTKEILAAQAVREAARLRSRLGIGPTSSVCPLDVAESLEITVHLQGLPSLEGMYAPGENKTIVLGIERPWGRIRHTCAHELAHYVFRHSRSIDQRSQLEPSVWNPEEFIADRFATALLMPKLAVVNAIRRRGWSSEALDPQQAFIIAQDFGVGFTNFVGHLETTLKLIGPDTARRLKHSGRNLKPVRNAIAGFVVNHDVFQADSHWGTRHIDIEIDDIVVADAEAQFEGKCAEWDYDPVPHLRGVVAGEGSLKLPKRQKAMRVRVSRRGFTGLARFRHMEEPDCE